MHSAARDAAEANDSFDLHAGTQDTKSRHRQERKVRSTDYAHLSPLSAAASMTRSIGSVAVPAPDSNRRSASL